MGTVDAKIKVLSAEKPELSKIASCTYGVGQNIAFGASLAAGNSALLTAPPFSFHSFIFRSPL